MPDGTRVDRWLWAVRVYRTRPDAAEACRGGHVRINDARVKPSATVRVGDVVHARAGNRTRILEVVELLDKRVGAPRAAACVHERTPAEPTVSAPPPARRERGAGRPTKRERRQLDRERGQGR